MTRTLTRLPDGFRARLRRELEIYPAPGGERLLVGGSPLRTVRLTSPAVAMLDDGVLAVSDPTTAQLARRLLDGNLADPEPSPPADPADLTVVVPVRDRLEQLDRCLATLTDAWSGVRIVVVDDASDDPKAVAAVARNHGAALLALPNNVGAAGARNAGLAEVTTPYVAFVDSDVCVDTATLLALAGHFNDPHVALVGPLVRGVVRSAVPRWFEAYDAAASSLALGRRSCSVSPGAAVAWLPSACLVGRTSAIKALDAPGSVVGGFDANRRVGEDVDLVWRLAAAGWRIRYQPDHVALHDVRTTIRGWLGRKHLYGTGGAQLAATHGTAVAPARLSSAMALAAAAVLLRRRWSLPLAAVATGWAAHVVHDSLPDIPNRNRLAAKLAAKGLAWSVAQESALLLRHWWPLTVLGCFLSHNVRRMVVTALLTDLVVANTSDKPLAVPPLSPMAAWSGRRLDDLAYGSGLWAGAIRASSIRCLTPHHVRPVPARHQRRGRSSALQADLAKGRL